MISLSHPSVAALQRHPLDKTMTCLFVTQKVTGLTFGGIEAMPVTPLVPFPDLDRFYPETRLPDRERDREIKPPACRFHFYRSHDFNIVRYAFGVLHFCHVCRTKPGRPAMTYRIETPESVFVFS